MVKLRLRRMGRKKRPVYDIVAADNRKPRDGRFIEKIGQYNPITVANQVTLRRDRVLHWLQTGAQPTDTVRSILRREGVLLELHLQRKGKNESEIAQMIENHVARRQNREARDMEAMRAEAELRHREEEQRAVEAARVADAAVEGAPAVEEAPAVEGAPAVEEAPKEDEG